MGQSQGYHGDYRNHKTPEHDEMCMFVHDNYQMIVNSITELLELDFEGIDDEDIYYNIPKFEEPVKFKKNDYNREQIIGYVDISTGVGFEYGRDFDTYMNSNYRGEFDYKFSDKSLFKPIKFEIKPKIESVGDVIRQIQYYREHEEDHFTQWVVVTKTDIPRKYFESQDIILLNYDRLKKFIAEEEEEIAREIAEAERKEAEELAEQQRKAKERQEKIDRMKSKAKKFVTGLFKKDK